MGHYFALVVSDEPSDYTINALMAPYYQGTEGVPSDFLEFVEDEYEDVDDETGERGYWTNMYGYWDWYGIGGCYMDILETKDHVYKDSCRASEFLRLVEDSMVAPHAIVDEDGWHDLIEMEVQKAASTFHQYLEDLVLFYPDAVLTVVDYHT